MRENVDISDDAVNSEGQISTQAHGRNIKAFISVGIVSSLSVLAKALQDFSLAYLVGANSTVDALGLAVSLGNFALTLLVGPIIASFLPFYITALERNGRAESNRLLGGALPTIFALAFVFTLLFELLSPLLLHLIARGNLAENTVGMGTNLLRLYMLLVPLRTGTQITTAILSVERKFAVPALTAIIPPLAAVGWLYAMPQIGVYAIVLGLVVGEAAQLAILVFLTLIYTGRFSLSWGGAVTELRLISRQYLPIFAGSGIASLNPLISQAIAGGLGAGAIARLVYGQKLIGVVLQVAALAVSTVLLPLFSRLVAVENWAALRQASIYYSGLIMAALIPVVVGFEFFSDDLVLLVLRHGAFTASDSAEVASIMRWGAYQIPFYIATTIIARVVAALQTTYILAVGAIITIVANIALAETFARLWGLQGIALSTAVAYFVSFFFMSAAVLIAVNKRISANQKSA